MAKKKSLGDDDDEASQTGVGPDLRQEQGRSRPCTEPEQGRYGGWGAGVREQSRS